MTVLAMFAAPAALVSFVGVLLHLCRRKGGK
jgi:hypothetical protein